MTYFRRDKLDSDFMGEILSHEIFVDDESLTPFNDLMTDMIPEQYKQNVDLMNAPLSFHQSIQEVEKQLTTLYASILLDLLKNPSFKSSLDLSSVEKREEALIQVYDFATALRLKSYERRSDNSIVITLITPLDAKSIERKFIIKTRATTNNKPEIIKKVFNEIQHVKTYISDVHKNDPMTYDVI